MRRTERLSEPIMEYSPEAFRCALVGTPPAKVQRMTVHRKPGPGMTQTRPRVYSPKQTTWLTEYSDSWKRRGWWL